MQTRAENAASCVAIESPGAPMKKIEHAIEQWRGSAHPVLRLVSAAVRRLARSLARSPIRPPARPPVRSCHGNARRCVVDHRPARETLETARTRVRALLMPAHSYVPAGNCNYPPPTRPVRSSRSIRRVGRRGERQGEGRRGKSEKERQGGTAGGDERRG